MCWRRRQWHPTPVLLPGKIPWMEEPGGLQSMGSLGVGHDWATSLPLFTFMHWRRKWQPTPVFLPGESQGWGAWWAAVYGVAQSWTRLKRPSSSSSSSMCWMKKMYAQEDRDVKKKKKAQRWKIIDIYSTAFGIKINMIWQKILYNCYCPELAVMVWTQ